jgi:single-stranded-DNA-specific exonuclease
MKKKITRRKLPTEPALFTPEVHPLLQRIYAARGILSANELERGLEHLLPYEGLLGLEKATALLAEVIIKQEKILIVGDFDADGATSTALAVRALKSLGAKEVEFLVPNRFAFGYGLTPELVEIAKEQKPALIVTVDNGIANHAGVTAAKAAGIAVLITDHHLPSVTLPEADAIVNPNQVNDQFPSKNLAGVGVIFYVMLALRRHLQSLAWFDPLKRPEPKMSQFLDLVALGTVADLVPLDYNNRILVHQGLGRIRQGTCIPGILALLEIAGKSYERVTTADLGFAVAARLNAAGRMDDMSFGINCLLSDNQTEALEMARKLNRLNEERRVVEQGMHESALEILTKLQRKETAQLPKGICLFDPSWHQGVIGILASRIKDRTHRPVIIFAPANDKELKGSARSIPNVHIRDVLANLATQFPQLIKKFGGHAMAAGLTIDRAAYEEFSQAFNAILSQTLKEEDLQHQVASDGELKEEELTLSIAEMLEEAGPWGQAFPEPVFDDVFRILDQRLVANKHLKLTLAKGERQVDAVAFNIDQTQWPNHRCQQIYAAYRLDINEFRNRRSVQLIVDHLEPAQ